jgi:aspartate/methionine/tyrosine aminotransferase
MLESRRMAGVQSPIIPIVADWIRQTPGTISLGQGVVSYGPPREAFDRLQSFGQNLDDHKYKPVVGLPELVDAFAEKLHRENGLPVPGPDSGTALVVTAGGNMGFMNVMLAILDPGDEVILPTPYYFNHEMAIAMASGRAVLVPTDDAYQLRLDRIEAALTPRTRAVVTVSPNNPTGAVYPEAALRAVNELCRQRGLYHVHDEAYEYFVYDGARHFSPGSIPGAARHTVSLYSLSKAYGFASWRIGCMVIPEALRTAVRKIQDTILICAPAVSQVAAVGALQAGRAYCDGHVGRLAGTRQQVLGALATLGTACLVPRAEGAFYFLLRLQTEMPSIALAERLVREHQVAVIPGDAFGLEAGCHLRVAYGALEPATVAEGVGRLVAGLKKILSL